MSIEEVRRRVQAATDTIEVPPPDVACLLEQARASGRGPGQQRWWALAAAAVLVVGTGVGYAALRGGDDPEVAGEPAPMVPATPKALAALAIDVLDLKPTAAYELHVDDASISTQLVLDPGRRELMLVVDGEFDEEVCDDGLDGCEQVETERGTFTLVWVEESGDDHPDAQGMVGVAHEDGGVFEAVVYLSPDVTDDPRRVVPRVVDDLVALVADERFGLRTTQELVGAEVEGWTENPEPPPGEGDSAAEGPGAGPMPEGGPASRLAAAVDDHVTTEAKVARWDEPRRGASIEVELPRQLGSLLSVHVTRGAEPATCDEAGATPDQVVEVVGCDTWDADGGSFVLGWQGDDEGFGMVTLTRVAADETHVATLTTPGVHGDPRTMDLPVSVDQLVALLSDPRTSVR